jgi:hypothetical protein
VDQRSDECTMEHLYDVSEDDAFSFTEKLEVVTHYFGSRLRFHPAMSGDAGASRLLFESKLFVPAFSVQCLSRASCVAYWQEDRSVVIVFVAEEPATADDALVGIIGYMHLCQSINHRVFPRFVRSPQLRASRTSPHSSYIRTRGKLAPLVFSGCALFPATDPVACAILRLASYVRLLSTSVEVFHSTADYDRYIRQIIPEEKTHAEILENSKELLDFYRQLVSDLSSKYPGDTLLTNADVASRRNSISSDPGVIRGRCSHPRRELHPRRVSCPGTLGTVPSRAWTTSLANTCLDTIPEDPSTPKWT